MQKKPVQRKYGISGVQFPSMMEHYTFSKIKRPISGIGAAFPGMGNPWRYLAACLIVLHQRIEQLSCHVTIKSIIHQSRV
ncbi:hypothetical protein D3C75_738000 [compost metagenome]